MMSWIAALALIGSSAPAAPTYLRCAFGSGENLRTFDVAIDEANQQVSIGFQGRPSSTMSALFSPAKITVTRPLGRETQTWVFDRVTMAVETTTSFEPSVEHGLCKLQPTPSKRAF